jgi:3-hydroxybutyryl-CoA dehydratase
MMNKGDTFTQKFTLSEEIYSGFIMLFNDNNPLHTDKAFAQQEGFRSEVMHGNILNGFLSYFIGECLPVKNVMLYSQEISYVKPVYLNDQLDLVARINTVSTAVNVIEFGFTFTNQEQVKVAKGKLQIGILP